MKTLREFCESTAAKIAGVPLAQVTACCGDNAQPSAVVESADGPLFGFDIQALIDLIGQIAMLIFQDCPANDAKVAAATKNLNWKQRIYLRVASTRACRAGKNMRWRSSHDEIASAMESEGNQLTDEDRVAVISDTREPDYNVV